jgi:hypothetical protein
MSKENSFWSRVSAVGLLMSSITIGILVTKASINADYFSNEAGILLTMSIVFMLLSFGTILSKSAVKGYGE